MKRYLCYTFSLLPSAHFKKHYYNNRILSHPYHEDSMDKNRILFVCVHNGAQSQMAEVFLNVLGNNRDIADSAGLPPGGLNPLANKVMKEFGLDISKDTTKSAFRLVQSGENATNTDICMQ